MKQVIAAAKSLPADGKVRLVMGFEAVHHPRTAIRAESVMIHEGDDAIRSIKTPKGWSRVDRVSWSGGGA